MLNYKTTYFLSYIYSYLLFYLVCVFFCVKLVLLLNSWTRQRDASDQHWTEDYETDHRALCLLPYMDRFFGLFTVCVIVDIAVDFNFCLLYSFCVVLISGQLSVPCPCCPALLYILLHFLQLLYWANKWMNGLLLLLSVVKFSRNGVPPPVSGVPPPGNDVPSPFGENH